MVSIGQRWFQMAIDALCFIQKMRSSLLAFGDKAGGVFITLILKITMYK